jgi:hypothetical protein
MIAVELVLSLVGTNLLEDLALHLAHTLLWIACRRACP